MTEYSLTCPWCGTSDIEWRTNCKNCGGPLPPRPEDLISAKDYLPAKPPPPPRDISDGYARKLMFTDALSIVSAIFSIIGGVFAFVGLILTILIVTAIVGIPFLGIGSVFMIFGIINLKNQWEKAKITVEVLRRGVGAEGMITEICQDYSVSVNRRHPYVINYSFLAGGHRYDASSRTYTSPMQKYTIGKKTWVLYLPENPEKNSLYPHP